VRAPQPRRREGDATQRERPKPRSRK
jgi:hypothetical protein